MAEEFQVGVTLCDADGNSYPLDTSDPGTYFVDYGGHVDPGTREMSYAFNERGDTATRPSLHPQHRSVTPINTTGLAGYQPREFYNDSASDAYLSPTYRRGPRRHSDYERPPSLACRTRSVSVSDSLVNYSQSSEKYDSGYPTQYNDDRSPSTASSSTSIPSPLPPTNNPKSLTVSEEAGTHGYAFAYPPPQAHNPQWQNYAGGSPIQVVPELYPDQLSPNTALLSPMSDASGHSLSPTDLFRGRNFASGRSSRRVSPYPRSRSRSSTRMAAEMGNLSLDTGRYSTNLSPIMPPGYLSPSDDVRLDPVAGLPELRTLDEMIGGTIRPEVLDRPPPSPYSESSFTLLQDEYLPAPPNHPVSPHQLQSGFRDKVGSEAIERAAFHRRTRPGDYVCDYAGCGATFTAKHNLQNHINSHLGIRNYKCTNCERDFGTSHVAKRHMRKCNGKKRRISPS